MPGPTAQALSNRTLRIACEVAGAVPILQVKRRGFPGAMSMVSKATQPGRLTMMPPAVMASAGPDIPEWPWRR